MDLVKYLEGHAYDFYSTLPEKSVNKNDYLHFTFSVKLPYFLINGYDEKDKMPEILKDLLKEAKYKVKDGKRVLKDGTIKQKWAIRKINLDNLAMVWAIHLKDVDNNKTEPHIHFLLKKDARLGRDFSLLKTHIINTLIKHNLIPHFADEKSVKSDKLLQKRVKNFTWEIRKSTNEKLKETIKKPDFIEKLELLWEYALQGQLQYYAKTMLTLQKRLNYLKKDLHFKGQNLRHIIPVPINELEKKALEAIKKREFTQKKLKELENSKIFDDYYRYCKTNDFKSSYILRLIKNNTNELKNLRKNETFIKNYEKVHKELLKEKIKNLKEKYYTQEISQEQKLNIAQVLKNDLLQIAQKCKNEKELREKMQICGYEDFGFKKRQGKVIAYKFKLEGKDYTVKCRDSLNISELRAILKENNIKAQAGQDLSSKTPETLRFKYVWQEIRKKNNEKPKINAIEIDLKKEEEIKKIKEIKKGYKDELTKTSKRVRESLKRASKVKRSITKEAERASNLERRAGTKVIDAGEIKRGLNESYKQEVTGIKREFRRSLKNGFEKLRKRIKNKINEFRERIKHTIKKLNRILEYREAIKRADKELKQTKKIRGIKFR